MGLLSVKHVFCLTVLERTEMGSGDMNFNPCPVLSEAKHFQRGFHIQLWPTVFSRFFCQLWGVNIRSDACMVRFV